MLASDRRIVGGLDCLDLGRIRFVAEGWARTRLRGSYFDGRWIETPSFFICLDGPARKRKKPTTEIVGDAFGNPLVRLSLDIVN
jgi:hypothetical protein